MPFSLIKNIASNVSEEIINERNENGLFKDFYDFLKRCYKGSVNKRVIISLVESGAFDIFNITDNFLNATIKKYFFKKIKNALKAL